MRNLLVAAMALVAAWAPASPSYVFSYFTNNGEDGLHLLASADGLRWTALNGGRSRGCSASVRRRSMPLR